LPVYNAGMRDREERRRLLQSEIEERLAERFAALRGELDRLRAESEGRWAGFAARLAQGTDGIVPVELLASPEGPPAVGQVPAAAVRELDLAATQVELLNHLLEASLRHASRAILLVLRNDTWSVWKAAGFGPSGDPRPEEAVRGVTLTAAGEGPLARVREGVPCRFGASNEVSARLLCADAAEAVVVPMTIGEKVNGALYADAAAGKEDRFDPDAIAVLAFVAGLLIERLSARKLRPSPALRAFERELRPKTAIEPPKPASARVQPPASAQPSLPPAPGVRRLTGPLAPPDGNERHAEARRFAELLVSEIKLYNERAVKEGREQGNVYKRLKGEIDLSRQMYEQKFPEAARAGSDFLREELVRILADGRPEALGM
jgi:hypothetical protein